ncbi:hypothetical protein [Oceanirhabdus seepicola]|uniref:Uncharacterized protein n=1 Tax=Oceanirhabdus seepicola TaxID=2828781 RepID=A0A9J6P2F6_9CLOT|nr:hypothetical protein [Oceanirhabdus seepicola]MCM1990699.1 hypothetical protein [Oceanirhabdus seepicola]
MNIYKKHILKGLLLTLVVIAIAMILFKIINNNSNHYRIGGYIHKNRKRDVSHTRKLFGNEEDFYNERFQRPSKESALKLKYEFKGNLGDTEPPYIPKDYPKKYDTPEDVIHAYYSIIKEASNTIGFHGGCGTVGLSRGPYLYAYNLLSNEMKKEISVKAYVDSFAGTGHTTLLKLLPAYHPPNTPENIRYHFVEIEVITGPPLTDKKEYKDRPTYFAYYYGIITTEYNEKDGWKIKPIDYIPEDFLCAPYHSWYWDSSSVVNVIYEYWYKLIDNIDKVEREGANIRIYASGAQNKYKFDFIRLTNGEDVLLHEYIKLDDKWKEVNILKKEHQYFKLSKSKFSKD